MCFAARNGLVAVSVSYRLAPAAPWPADAKDVAAAISWIYENADLFGGNGQEIIPIGYATGAYHLASFLAHRNSRRRTPTSPAPCWCRAFIIRPPMPVTPNAPISARTPANMTASPRCQGLTAIEVPIVLAWSSADRARFVAQGEKLKDMLCSAGHCPRFALLTKPGSPASVFDLDGSSGDLHDRLRQLIGQIDARGLPCRISCFEMDRPARDTPAATHQAALLARRRSSTGSSSDGSGRCV